VRVQSSGTMASRSAQWQKEKEQKAMKMREENEQKELADCTFAPSYARRGSKKSKNRAPASAPAPAPAQAPTNTTQHEHNDAYKYDEDGTDDIDEGHELSRASSLFGTHHRQNRRKSVEQSLQDLDEFINVENENNFGDDMLEEPDDDDITRPTDYYYEEEEEEKETNVGFEGVRAAEMPPGWLQFVTDEGKPYYHCGERAKRLMSLGY